MYPSNQNSFDAPGFPSALRSCTHCPQLDPPRTTIAAAVAALENNTDNSINEAANEQKLRLIFICRLSRYIPSQRPRSAGFRRLPCNDSTRAHSEQSFGTGATTITGATLIGRREFH
jgi:hypothetical protein